VVWAGIKGAAFPPGFSGLGTVDLGKVACVICILLCVY
jgi:hypothetical protein